MWLFLPGIVLTLVLGLSGSVAAAAATEPRDRAFSLSISNGTISAKIEKVPLVMVLKELRRQSGAKVSAEPSVAEDEVSVEFHNLPLEEGIARMLKGTRYVLVYGQRSGGRGSPQPVPLAEIIVLGRSDPPGRSSSDQQGTPVATPPRDVPRNAPLGPFGGTKKEAKVAPPQPEKSPELQEDTRTPLEELTKNALHASEPDDRIEALRELADWAEEADISPTLAMALRDPELEVRMAALDLLRDSRIPMPVSALAMTARSDLSPDIRLEALDLLAETVMSGLVGSQYESLVRVALLQGLHDPDPTIQEEAQDLIEQLDASKKQNLGGSK